MDYVYFNCILSEPTITTVGNYAYTFRCTVTCDAPWAWEWPQTYSVGKIANNGTFEFDNISDDNYYMYPKISFTTTGTSCGIINVTDKNNGPTFKDLIAGETITMDSDRCILTSSRDVLRLSNMTGCFLRLVPGVNTIKITGGINSMTIEYQNARKVIG